MDNQTKEKLDKALDMIFEEIDKVDEFDEYDIREYIYTKLHICDDEPIDEEF